MTQSFLIIIARILFAAVFAVAAWFKFTDMAGTAGYISSVGLPMPVVLAWLAAIFEVALVIAFLTGAFFSEAALLAAVYVLFLGIAFHGPSHWPGNQLEFGLFVNHLNFIGGLLFAAIHGPGSTWAAGPRLLWRHSNA